MGELISSVREAEERLAAIARTLQSAYEEELSKAQTALESATRGLRHAEALEQAADALGRSELGERLREVREQFRASEHAARLRLEELANIEATVTMRLSGPGSGSSVPPALPERNATTASSAPNAASTPSSVSTPFPSSKSAAPGDAGEGAGGSEGKEPTAEVLDLLNRVKQLEPRVDQVARVGPRAPREELRLAVQEHVALARLLQERLEAAGWDGRSALDYSLRTLGEITNAHSLEEIVGLKPDETAEWNRVAAQARARRQVLAEERKSGASS